MDNNLPHVDYEKRGRALLAGAIEIILGTMSIQDGQLLVHWLGNHLQRIAYDLETKLAEVTRTDNEKRT